MPIRPSAPRPLPAAPAVATVRPAPVPPAAPAAPATPTTPPTPPPRMPEEGGLRRGLQAAYTGGMAFLAKIPGIHAVGLAIFGWMSRPKADDPSLGNLAIVAPRLLRGAQPDDAGFAALARQGVKTVINLREERTTEGPAVAALGMTYLPLPITPVGPPTIAQGEAFLSAVTDPANGKVFVHCHRGADRTGAMMAVYRIAAEGWSVDRALAEMTVYGFREGYEQDKLDFVRRFAAEWATRPSAERARLLHQG